MEGKKKDGSVGLTCSICGSACRARCHVAALRRSPWEVVARSSHASHQILAGVGRKTSPPPFLRFATRDTIATRWKTSSPPRHSTHALASSVKCLKPSSSSSSSSSVLFRAEITERALMWNMRLHPPFISSVLHLFSLVSSHWGILSRAMAATVRLW